MSEFLEVPVKVIAILTHRHSRASGNPGAGDELAALGPRFRGDDEH